MCFSAQADLVGGAVVSAIGIDVLLHVRGRRRYLPLAALPLLLGLHQIDEAFVWWGLQGHVSAGLGRLATWLYLLFAFVVLPIYVPAALMCIERVRRRRMAMIPLVVLGAVVSAILLAAMIRGPVVAELRHLHLGYRTDLHAGWLVVMLYVAATCGALILSGFPDVAVFGVVNLVAVAVLSRLTLDGFASLWCGWAAICSGAFAVHLRYGRGGTKRVRPAVAG
ncbi:MAG: hypothetical protein Q7V57_06700 [Actinomycetota bacterium]|nr:hypothetical protein [Actinomycetota bacterium]